MSGTLPDITLTSHFAGGDADLSQYVRDASFSISRGSSQPSLTGLIADAGQFSATLTNTDRRFDPSFTTGPYFGDLVPGVLMDLVATYPTGGTDYPLFAGTNTKWPQIYPNQRVDQITQIECADAVRAVARAQLTEIFPRQLTGARIQAIRDLILLDWGSNITEGTCQVPFFGDGQSASSAWSMMMDACSAEWGALFVTAAGALTFLDRSTIAGEATWSTPQAVFGDAHAGGELMFTDAIVAFDDERIVNDADLLYNQYGSKGHAEDLTSQAEPWGKMSWQQNFQLANGAYARSYVHEVVRRYANPTIRIEKLIVKPQRDPTNLWPVVLGLELGQQITVKLTPKGGGARIEQDCYIRHIQHDYGNRQWQTTYDVDDSSLVTVNAFYDGTFNYDGAIDYSF